MNIINLFWKLNNAKALRKFADFLGRARIHGLVILCPRHEFEKTFRRNVELWAVWFRNAGIDKCRLVHELHHKGPHELCVLLHHLHPGIKKQHRDVLSLQTEKKVIQDDSYLLVEFSDYYLGKRVQNGFSESTVWLPLTFCLPPEPSMNPLPSFQERPIDAVLFGAWSARRQNAVQFLVNQGLNIMFSSDYTYYDTKLTQFLVKTKMFLNIGYNNALTSLETHRICQAANQHVVIISERASDTLVQNFFDGPAVLFCNPVENETSLVALSHLLLEFKNNESKYVNYCANADQFWRQLSSDLPLILQNLAISTVTNGAALQVDMRRFQRHVVSDFRNYARRMGRHPRMTNYRPLRSRMATNFQFIRRPILKQQQQRFLRQNKSQRTRRGVIDYTMRNKMRGFR
jgi:hypothetical protein